MRNPKKFVIDAVKYATFVALGITYFAVAVQLGPVVFMLALALFMGTYIAFLFND